MQFKKGGCRWVLLIGGLAFKIPSLSSWTAFLRGLLSSTQEISWWRWAQDPVMQADPDHRLCPILFWIPGGFLVVMKRVYIPPNFNRKFTSNYCNDLKPLFDRLPFDSAPSNFGFIGRHLVLVDYG